MKKVFAIAVAVLLIAVSALPVFAESVTSPKATTADYIINVPEDVDGGKVVFDFKTDVDEDGNQVVVIRGIPEDDYDFAGWTIDGDYVPHGSLTDSELELLISGDIKVVPSFVKKGETVPATQGGSTPAGDKVVDDGSKSPKTGSSDSVAYFVLFTSIAALLVTVAVAKRRSADR